MDSLHSQYQALLEISEAIASQRDLDKLYAELAPLLHRVVQFEFANLILYDADRKAVKSHVLETPDPAYTCPAGDCPMESPAAGFGRRRSLGWFRAWLRTQNFPNCRAG